jgi:hypothetical protein
MIPNRLTLEDIQQAFRDLEAKIKAFESQNIDLKGKRIINAGMSVDQSDYVTKLELSGLQNYVEKDLAATPGEKGAKGDTGPPGTGVTGTPGQLALFNSLGTNIADSSVGEDSLSVGCTKPFNAIGAITSYDAYSNEALMYVDAYGDAIFDSTGSTGIAAIGTVRIAIEGTTGHIGINKVPNARTFLTINLADLPQGNAEVPLGLDSNALQSGDIWLDTQAIVTGAYTLRVKS